MTEPTLGERVSHRVSDETHNCIRPGCTQRALVAYHVDQATRLGGQDLAIGDFIDLCPDDDQEVRRAMDAALALGWGGPFDDLLMRLHETGIEPDPFARFREWH